MVNLCRRKRSLEQCNYSDRVCVVFSELVEGNILGNPPIYLSYIIVVFYFKVYAFCFIAILIILCAIFRSMLSFIVSFLTFAPHFVLDLPKQSYYTSNSLVRNILNINTYYPGKNDCASSMFSHCMG